MAVKKITLSDVTKKHIKILGYLVVSAVLAYGLSILADKQEIVYLSPVINYVIYAVEQELKKEGYIKAIKK